MFVRSKKQLRMKKLILLALSLELMSYTTVSRSMWVHPINKTREDSGEFNTLITRQLVNYPDKFYSYFRMSQEKFHDILEKIKPHIQGEICNYRENLSPEFRLAVCLRYVILFCFRSKY